MKWVTRKDVKVDRVACPWLILGRSGKLQPDGVFKFSMPRKDLKVTVEGTAILAGLALGSWVAFEGTRRRNAMAMGDLVLTEDEVGPVMLKLQQHGIQQTAVHNHLLHESPRVMYMHIAGQGDAVKMAKAIHDASPGISFCSPTRSIR